MLGECFSKHLDMTVHANIGNISEVLFLPLKSQETNKEQPCHLGTSISIRLASSGPCWRQALAFDNRGCSSAQFNLLGMTQNTRPPLWFLAIESDSLYATQNVARNAVIQS